MSALSDAIIALSPKGYWRASDASGNVQDSSGLAHHATSMAGTPVYGETSIIPADALPAITFDGATEYAQIADHADFDQANAGTYIIFAKILTRTGNRTLIDKGANSMQMQYDGTAKRLRMNVNSVGADVAFANVTTDNADMHM